MADFWVESVVAANCDHCHAPIPRAKPALFHESTDALTCLPCAVKFDLGRDAQVMEREDIGYGPPTIAARMKALNERLRARHAQFLAQWRRNGFRPGDIPPQEFKAWVAHTAARFDTSVERVLRAAANPNHT